MNTLPGIFFFFVGGCVLLGMLHSGYEHFLHGFDIINLILTKPSKYFIENIIMWLYSLEIDFQQQNISLLIKFVYKTLLRCKSATLIGLLALELPQITHSVYCSLINRKSWAALLTQLNLKKFTPKRKNAYFKTETSSLYRHMSIP